MSRTSTIELHRSSGDAPRPEPLRAPASDDKAMLKAAADLTRDLNSADPKIYWADLLASALVGYGGLFTAILASSTGVAIIAGVISVLALYRAGSFIHELTHIKPNAVPGVPPRVEPDRRHSAARAVLHVRRCPQPAPRQALLRDGQRSRISAACSDEALDPADLPDRRGARSDRHADPFRRARALVAAFPEAARDGRRQIFRAADQSAVPPSSSGRRVPPRNGSRWRSRAASGRLPSWRWLARAWFRSARSSSSSELRRA